MAAGTRRSASSRHFSTLATSPATGFRVGSSRIVVWFGDAIGHDPCNGATEATATAALIAAGARVIAISTGAANDLNGTGQAQRIATATGGTFMAGASDDEVSDAILEGLSNLPVTVTHAVTCDPGVSASLTPASRSGTSGDTFTFDETYGVNAGTLAGTYGCTVQFLINGMPGGAAFTETITITVPGTRPRDREDGPGSGDRGQQHHLHADGEEPRPDDGDRCHGLRPGAGELDVRLGERGLRSAAGLVTCTAGTMAPGATQVFTIVVKAGSGNTVVNAATIDGLTKTIRTLANNVGDGDDQHQSQPGLHRRHRRGSASSGRRTTRWSTAGSPE